MRFLILIAMGLLPLNAHAQKNWSAQEIGPGKMTYEANMHIYRVMTNITGNGLTSQTISGVPGSTQVVHVKWDDIEVVMDGDLLTFDGQSQPKHDNIIRLASPNVLSRDTKGANISIRDSNQLQYFERKEGNLFELKSLDFSNEKQDKILGDIPILEKMFNSPPKSDDKIQNAMLDLGPGIHVRLEPSAKAGSDLWDTKFNFQFLWFDEREPIEGVELKVGKPKLDGVGVFGKIGVRNGQWSCYETPTPSQGRIYLFLKITSIPIEDTDDSAEN